MKKRLSDLNVYSILNITLGVIIGLAGLLFLNYKLSSLDGNYGNPLMYACENKNIDQNLLKILKHTQETDNDYYLKMILDDNITFIGYKDEYLEFIFDKNGLLTTKLDYRLIAIECLEVKALTSEYPNFIVIKTPLSNILVNNSLVHKTEKGEYSIEQIANML